MSGKFKPTHGMRHSRAYTCWTNMKQRCLNKNNKSFPNYGGRGIKICEEWLGSFDAFYNDMGDPPKGLTIDRIDVNKGYFPENCRWVDRKSQQRNTTRNQVICFQGERKTVAEWSEITGISVSVLSYRVRAGWSGKLCIQTPPHSGNRISAKLGDTVDVPEVLV